MTKEFCDVCGRELTRFNAINKCSVMIVGAGTANNGVLYKAKYICNHCRTKIVRYIDNLSNEEGETNG